jgi:hypothetical protein
LNRALSLEGADVAMKAGVLAVSLHPTLVPTETGKRMLSGLACPGCINRRTARCECMGARSPAIVSELRRKAVDEDGVTFPGFDFLIRGARGPVRIPVRGRNITPRLNAAQ